MANNGYAIMAFNNSKTDYVALASTLRKSIHRVMPDAKVTLITNSDVSDHNYDHIVRVNDVDETDWKLGNDWQVYEHSPYDRTIKLEADLYIPRRIDHWWDILANRDMNICSTIRNYKNEISHVDFYRGTFTGNNLLNTYNAITYFKKSDMAEKFYTYVRDIFENEDDYADFIQVNREPRISTDVVYAIAARAIGGKHCMMPEFTDFSMIHMKRMINGVKMEEWYEQLPCEIHPHTLRVATFPQMYPFHYNRKEFGKMIDEELE